MEHLEQESVLQRVAKSIKKTISTVKAVPYFFLIIYAIYLILTCINKPQLTSVLDFIYGYSVSCCIILLMMSSNLGLCIWHKIACLFPMLSLFVIVTDTYFFYLTFEETMFINICIMIFIICYLVWSFFHFFIDGK